MSEETVKCPFCGYVYRTDVKAISNNGIGPVLRKLGLESIHPPSSHDRVDLECPHCGEEFEWPQK